MKQREYNMDFMVHTMYYITYHVHSTTYRVHPETICCFTVRIRYAAAMLLLDLLQPPIDPEIMLLGFDPVVV